MLATQAKGSTASVLTDALNSTVKVKYFNDTTSRVAADYEVRLMKACPPNICAPILHYEYPRLEMQKMDETLAAFITRKQPTIQILSGFIDNVARKCMVFYASGLFHCDLMLHNITLLYRTPQSTPLLFFVDSGISMLRYERDDGVPRKPDNCDAEYDFCFFLYSCLCYCTYLFDDLYTHISPFIPTLKRYFEHYHGNGRNHQWYRVGIVYQRLGWKIDLTVA